MLPFAFSCTNTEENTGSIIVFDRNESLDNFDIGSITDSLFQIIPLETNEDYLISSIDKIEIQNDHIYIKDDLAKSIYIFDMNGKYSGKINAIGNGPGEYVIPSYMTVADTSIIIVDNPTGKQIKYNLLSLQAIEEKRVFDKIWCTEDIFVLSGTLYYVNAWGESNSGKFRLFSANGDNYSKYLPFKKEPFGLNIHGPVYAINKDQASVIYSQDDIIYKITSNSVKPAYKVLFKNEKIEYFSGKTESVFNNLPGRVISMDAINESDNYLFIDVAYTINGELPLGDGNYDIYTCLYNKSEDNKIIYPKSAVFDSKFDNEQIIIEKIIGNRIISWREASVLLAQKEYLYKNKIFVNKVFEARLNDILSNLTEDDNPVLFIYNLK
jgi:hypothetical protein